ASQVGSSSPALCDSPNHPEISRTRAPRVNRADGYERNQAAMRPGRVDRNSLKGGPGRALPTTQVYRDQRRITVAGVSGSVKLKLAVICAPTESVAVIVMVTLPLCVGIPPTMSPPTGPGATVRPAGSGPESE